ncbi:PD-(D/E)XK nuclease family protein [Bradyrhizobium sp. U87765 SZCCT0131]|uniref:PD-(D/E)XK nuclease family protein n=1 Tax=unclassified Bradyrhizobium TaxID=2631580 RepID=UPI001BAC17FE|nr:MULTISPECIES: PD-(D/E)XK nuclease family protein [unclassified Bradyrhizobium]MBR1217499.1 PD-(D/E)XK nuclease family protein [Bradyrhizobium sp. U87765 SZCCT0131]MBR1264903.1 PD-(D/E)XK nuclease family protein [Bradyrhizobium sp. U87765 SZCCT0134]MBR1304885.1 PD-(D/E)XK nuclease family protein [Bradyrhizobium sp. U87765 SZCCT0110]MBR1320672.1 PD-(D/E)XK nuclease family protein [Bradyrhizobium sp. U87765 SZCCT0109]MBR1349092.1 PD-(D/E)XK nuclease family protein [Bradyrhizobium sp. U87765 SZ
MQTALSIRPLATTSPSLGSEMKICALRAGLASCREADEWVLHDPRLWLGTALHALLEKAKRKGLADIEGAWDGEIVGFVQRIGSHQFDRRFSDPTRWPAYYLTRQRALSSAAKLNSATKPSSGGVQAPPWSGTERRLTARGGRLVGRPDRFDRTTVTDIKSNLPDRATPLGIELFGRHRRQILIYAAIIAESLGFWPNKGVIAGASGETIEFGLAPAECDAEADAAIADLDAWNSALTSAARAADLASPSEASCGSCRFQLVCPAFWEWLARRTPNGAALEAPIAVSGQVSSVQLGNDGDLQSVTLAGAVSTVSGMTTASVVTRRSIHGALPASSASSGCRIVAASMRRDGRLVADWATLLVPLDRIPAIGISLAGP